MSGTDILYFFAYKFCSCRNTCSRRSGRKQRGCPCKDEDLKCVDGCACGTKKAGCKNKLGAEGVVAVTNAGKDAFERHQIAVAEARHQITVRVPQCL